MNDFQFVDIITKEESLRLFHRILVHSMDFVGWIQV